MDSKIDLLIFQPCTEVLFIDIFHEYNQTLTPVLLEMVHGLQGKFLKNKGTVKCRILYICFCQLLNDFTLWYLILYSAFSLYLKGKKLTLFLNLP